MKRLKVRIRWSKVPRVLGALHRVMAILVTHSATAGGGDLLKMHVAPENRDLLPF